MLSEMNVVFVGLGVGEVLWVWLCVLSVYWMFVVSGCVLGYYGNVFVVMVGGKGDGLSVGGVMGKWLMNLCVFCDVVWKILLEKIFEAWIRWGTRVVDYAEDDEKVMVMLDIGEKIEGVILVVVDGVWLGMWWVFGVGVDLKFGELRYFGVAFVTGFTDLDDALLRG